MRRLDHARPTAHLFFLVLVLILARSAACARIGLAALARAEDAVHGFVVFISQDQPVAVDEWKVTSVDRDRLVLKYEDDEAVYRIFGTGEGGKADAGAGGAAGKDQDEDEDEEE